MLHLVLVLHVLEYHAWSWVRTHKTLTLSYVKLSTSTGKYMEKCEGLIIDSNVRELEIKCDTLICHRPIQIGIQQLVFARIHMC